MYKNLRKKFVVRALRRASLKWPPRNNVKKKARVRRGVYKCNKCKEEVRVQRIALDHVYPVANADGFSTWDDYIMKMFAPESGWQVLCKPCHQKKTREERGKK